MRVGIVSDIHCNAQGLLHALTLMGDVDEVICAGDTIFQYRFSNDVIRILRERGARTILGNHDEIFLSPHGDRARSSPTVNQRELAWLADRPLDLRVQTNGKSIHVVHGSPWEPRYEYLYPHSETLKRFADFDADFVVLGHTHYQMAERVGRTLVINPGSAGESRDARIDYQLSYAVLDTQTDEVTFGNFPDPAKLSAAGGLANAAGQSYTGL
jgi:putative phosphoesterase